MGARNRSAAVPKALEGLTPALRMKGGVLYDPEENGFFAIVHSWDNMLAYGEPEEWRSTELFATEEAAMRHYKRTIRPALHDMMEDVKKSGVTSHHRTLG